MWNTRKGVALALAEQSRDRLRAHLPKLVPTLYRRTSGNALAKLVPTLYRRTSGNALATRNRDTPTLDRSMPDPGVKGMRSHVYVFF